MCCCAMQTYLHAVEGKEEKDQAEKELFEPSQKTIQHHPHEGGDGDGGGGGGDGVKPITVAGELELVDVDAHSAGSAGGGLRGGIKVSPTINDQIQASGGGAGSSRAWFSGSSARVAPAEEEVEGFLQPEPA